MEDEDQVPIAQRTRRWRFDYPADVDVVQHAAVRAAARFVREHADLIPAGVVTTNATQHAVLAVRLHDAFLQHDGKTGRTVVVEPEPEVVRVCVASRLSPRDRAR